MQDIIASRSGVPALAKLIDNRYPVNDTSITDQVRADEYLRELVAFDKSGAMEQLTVLTLTSDHTNSTRPGSPTPRAMVADDDLALGRIVEGVTKSRCWPSTLVLVVEDDAQNGLDHVDGHRTVALAIGAHIRRGVVDSNFYDHSSMIRTIQDIFRIPPQTRFVAAARPMTSIFTPVSKADPSRVGNIVERPALHRSKRLSVDAQLAHFRLRVVRFMPAWPPHPGGRPTLPAASRSARTIASRSAVLAARAQIPAREAAS